MKSDDIKVPKGGDNWEGGLREYLQIKLAIFKVGEFCSGYTPRSADTIEGAKEE